MGVPGLFGCVTRDANNLQLYWLHDTYLVVDADNYVKCMYRKLDLKTQFGGEYLEMTIRILEFLSELHQCNVTPIFIFDGLAPREGTKMKIQMKRNEENIADLSRFLNLGTKTPEMLPLCLVSLLACILRKAGIRYVFWEREADSLAADSSLYLNCPVLANDSDYFLFTGPRSDGCQVIPLDSLTEQRAMRMPPAYPGGYGMSCKIFRRNESCLGQVDTKLLPMIAVLVGNDLGHSVEWPVGAQTCLQRFGRVTRINRVKAALMWLNQFKGNKNNVVNELVKSNSGDRVNILNIIEQVYRDYELDPELKGKQMADMLELSKSGSFIEKRTDFFDIDGAFSKLKLSENSNVSADMPIFAKWPTDFRKHFHEGNLSATAFDSIYTKGGCVLRTIYEDINNADSIYVVSERIRLIICDILLELEEKLDCKQKTCGYLNDGMVCEHRRSGMEMRLSRLKLPRARISDRKSATEFMRQHLNLDLSGCKINESSVYLVYLLTLWLKLSPYAKKYGMTKMKSSSICLAVSACFLVMQTLFQQEMDIESLRKTIKITQKRFEACIWKARTQLPFSICTVHQFNELQVLHRELSALLTMLNVLPKFYGRSSEPFSFSGPPVFCLFPSGELVYCMAIELEALPAEKRIEYVEQTWIPQLSAGNEHVIPYVRREFISLIDEVDHVL